MKNGIKDASEACKEQEPKEKDQDDEMADRRSTTSSPGGAGVFAKRVQRQLSRAQEKVLQKLGKTDETKDEDFEQCCQDFNQQQVDGNKLFKDLKAYYNSVKAMHETSKQLSHTLIGIYNSDLQGDEDLRLVMAKEEPQWTKYEEELADQCLRIMENYMSQFPDIKEKVAKRGRKLVDYDSTRHHLEVLKNAKKKDDAKIAKAKDEFSTAERIFDDINTELKEELPVLYQSRIGCYVAVIQSISSLRDIFYHEMCTLNHEVYSVMKNLEAQHAEKVDAARTLQSSGSKKRRSRILSSPVKTTFPLLTRKISFRQSDRSKDGDFTYYKGRQDIAGKKVSGTLERQPYSPPKASRSLPTEAASTECNDSELKFRGSNESMTKKQSEASSDRNESEDRRNGHKPEQKEMKEAEEEQEKQQDPQLSAVGLNESNTPNESSKINENGEISTCLGISGDHQPREENGEASEALGSDLNCVNVNTSGDVCSKNSPGFLNKPETLEAENHST